MELEGTSLVALRETKTDLLKISTAVSLYRNHDLLTRHDAHTPGWQQFTGGTSFFMYHSAEGKVVDCKIKTDHMKASKSGSIKLGLLFRFWTEEGSDESQQ